jgi:hypothetical protein
MALATFLFGPVTCLLHDSHIGSPFRVYRLAASPPQTLLARSGTAGTVYLYRVMVGMTLNVVFWAAPQSLRID